MTRCCVMVGGQIEPAGVVNVEGRRQARPRGELELRRVVPPLRQTLTCPSAFAQVYRPVKDLPFKYLSSTSPT